VPDARGCGAWQTPEGAGGAWAVEAWLPGLVVIPGPPMQPGGRRGACPPWEPGRALGGRGLTQARIQGRAQVDSRQPPRQGEGHAECVGQIRRMPQAFLHLLLTLHLQGAVAGEFVVHGGEFPRQILAGLAILRPKHRLRLPQPGGRLEPEVIAQPIRLHVVCRGLRWRRRTGYALKAGQLTYDWRYSTMHGMPVTGGRGFRGLKPLWYNGVPP